MRILLADDQSEVRSALRLLLEQWPGLAVVGEAADAADLLAQAGAVTPDVVLLDWELPPGPPIDPAGNGITGLVAALHCCCPCVMIVALSGRPEAHRAAIAAGADAFVSKGDPPEHLLATLKDFGRCC